MYAPYVYFYTLTFLSSTEGGLIVAQRVQEVHGFKA
jgi:hypothetical protein